MVLPRNMKPLGHGPDGEVDTRVEETTLRTFDTADASFEHERPEWFAAAVCAGMDADLFFEQEHTAAARAVCAACPVKLQCRDYARTERIEFGVFGGETARQRRALRKRNA